MVDVGEDDLGNSIALTAAAMMVAAKFELLPTRLGFSAVAAIAVSGYWMLCGCSGSSLASS